MTDRPDAPKEFSIATFNVKNLALPDAEYYHRERYTPEEYRWKAEWLSDQLVKMDADIVAFQEIFDQAALDEVVDLANQKGAASNEASIPDKDKPYWRKTIFHKIRYNGYAEKAVLTPNIHDGDPGKRRPGLAILSRFPFIEPPVALQDLSANPLEIDLPGLGGGDAGHYKIETLSRPILRARINVHGQPVTVFNLHLKSKLPEFETPPGADFPPEWDLVEAEPFARQMGAFRALVRRAAEALVLRRLILEELEQRVPVIALGDFNDNQYSVCSEIVRGERPFKNYSWIRKPGGSGRSERYSEHEDRMIRNKLYSSGMYSAEQFFVSKSLRDMVYTSAFGGVYESIDQILLSNHFHPSNPGALGKLTYMTSFNDHLSDLGHEEAPHNKLASDHGQLVATLRWREGRV